MRTITDVRGCVRALHVCFHIGWSCVLKCVISAPAGARAWLKWLTVLMCESLGMEPHDWMWLATRETLIQGWNAKSYPRFPMGNNRYAFDADAGYEYIIQQYIEAFGPKFDLAKYRTYGSSEQLRSFHWRGRGALDFTAADKRRNFIRRVLSQEKEAYTAQNMHGLTLNEDCTVFNSVQGQILKLLPCC